MKWIALIALIAADNSYAEVWNCEMQPRVLGQSRHGETVTHTFTRLPPDDNGYVSLVENFTTDLEYNVEWWVIRENEHLIDLMTRSSSTEVEKAVLFKKDGRAVKTLLMADVPVIIADQGECEISDQAEED